MTRSHSFVPYSPIESRGGIGDRRTAALVAADGTIDWLCQPDYDGLSIFGALLDADHGGFWRMGPHTTTLGHQRYVSNSAVLLTSWVDDGAALELMDAMAWPQNDRPEGTENQRILLRRLHCTRGVASYALAMYPRQDFRHPARVELTPGGVCLQTGDCRLFLWATCPVEADAEGVHTTGHLRAGEEIWAVLAMGTAPEAWTICRAQEALAITTRYWQRWLHRLTYTGPRGDRVRRTAVTVHLLSYAPAGSLVAAPTTSLPERIGGDRNYDYRFAWIRDASLSLAMLALLGNHTAARQYMDWLAGLGSSTEAPLQVVYRLDGGTDLPQVDRMDLSGYRGSRPVRIGNHAFTQRQLDSLGYLADCALIYLEQGGKWRDAYWHMIRRIADYTAATWRMPDSGIWELPDEQHYVSSKVMSWVALERAVKIAQHVGHIDKTSHWRAVMDEIHADVMQYGWSDRLGAFRQHDGAHTLDAAVLLIAVMGFLPADHPRVLATAARIAESLTLNGLVHRFQVDETSGKTALPLGEFEGAFLPCTFWLATTYAMAGRTAEAEAILAHAEALTGDLGLFAEEADARSGRFLGNTPLLFAQVEYVRAVMELAKARPLELAKLMVGKIEQRIRRFFRMRTGPCGEE